MTWFVISDIYIYIYIIDTCHVCKVYICNHEMDHYVKQAQTQAGLNPTWVGHFGIVWYT